MKDYKEYFNMMIVESMHPEIEDILNSNIPLQHKHNLITKKIRELTKNGVDTGIEDGKPKKGSSRAVYFPKEPKKIILDGKETHLPVVTKIAFPGSLDKYKDHDEPLLGEIQNETENDYYSQKRYGILHGDEHNHYHTNEEGILAPLTDAHEDSHWLEFGKINKLKKSEFQNLTKNKEYPKGIKFDDMHKVVNNEYENANGKHSGIPYGMTQEHYDHVYNHPLVTEVMNFTFDTGHHLGDLVIGNWGKFKHPHTGKEYPVISDYGHSTEVAKMYRKHRNKEFDYKRNKEIYR